VERFDKYFAGRTGPGRYAADPASIDLNAFIRQADGACRLLARRGSVDRRRLLAGHSQGGMYAIPVAESVTPHLAGLAMAEPQDVRILDLVAPQIGESLDAQAAQGTITADTARRNARGVRQAIDDFRAGLPPSVVTALTPFVVRPTSARNVRTNDAVYRPTTPPSCPAAPASW
jgi:hypothetical protein